MGLVKSSYVRLKPCSLLRRCPPPSIEVTFSDPEWILHHMVKILGGGRMGRDGTQRLTQDFGEVEITFVHGNYTTVARL